MKRSDYRCFCNTNFLDDALYQSMLIPENQFVGKGLMVSDDGSYTVDLEEFTLKNRYKDNSVLLTALPTSLAKVIEVTKNRLIREGLKNPVAFNIRALVNPESDPMSRGHGWHKDYNCVPHIDDPLKLWITMMVLSNDASDSTFMVSPGPEGPGLWNIGYKKIVCPNMLFAHNMNLGHEYIAGAKNNLSLLYIRWYDTD